MCVLVDDGSGVVSCVQWRKTRESSESIYQPGIGQLVSVLGTVDQFRDQRQLKVTAISKSGEQRFNMGSYRFFAEFELIVFTNMITQGTSQV